MIGKDGKITWVLDRGRVSDWDEAGNPLRVTGTHIDMTKEKNYEAQLALLAHHDPLTGLANRHALSVQFAQMQAEGPLCVAFIDLDNFKHVNDMLGHRSGDEVLIQLSQRMLDCLPPVVLVGRLGGDEFVLLMPFLIEYPKVRLLAQALLEAALQPFDVDNGLAQIGASIGVAPVRAKESFDDALKRADEVMYQVKRNGKQGIRLAASGQERRDI